MTNPSSSQVPQPQTPQPQIPQPRAGYTLPVFVCAGAIAALRWLQQDLAALTVVSVDLVEPPETVEIPIEQVARLTTASALAITRSDPGDNLDLTRNTPIWAIVEIFKKDEDNQTRIETTDSTLQLSPLILLEGGEGIGRQINADDQPAIYAYARRLLQTNLSRWLRPSEKIKVTVVLPKGRNLAQRTSNAAFGVVEGLSLLGTSGIAQPLSAPGQLEAFRAELHQKAALQDCLVFCIGENGLDLAVNLGIPKASLLKTANWLGPLLVEAGMQGIQSILLFGYHGKLIKLAGGVFHTHHHVADSRQEILTAHCANLGLPTLEVQKIFASATTEAALQHLRHLDEVTGSSWVNQVYSSIAQQIDQRSQSYIRTHSDRSLQVGSVLFDRDRQILVQSQIGAKLLQHCQSSEVDRDRPFEQ